MVTILNINLIINVTKTVVSYIGDSTINNIKFFQYKPKKEKH